MSKVYFPVTVVDQPTVLRCCGQCVVAMAAAVDLPDVCRFYGASSTTCKALVRMLRYFDCAPATDRLVRIPRRADGKADWKQVPQPAVLKVPWENREGSHWVLLANDHVYDSCAWFADPCKAEDATSYLSFTRLTQCQRRIKESADASARA